MDQQVLVTVPAKFIYKFAYLGWKHAARAQFQFQRVQVMHSLLIAGLKTCGSPPTTLPTITINATNH